MAFMISLCMSHPFQFIHSLAAFSFTASTSIMPIVTLAYKLANANAHKLQKPFTFVRMAKSPPGRAESSDFAS
jgi:hypothetical protein